MDKPKLVWQETAEHRGAATLLKSKTNLEFVVDWLLEPNEPSIRFLTLTQLVGRDDLSGNAVEARRRIPLRGWVRHLLAKQREGSYWVYPKSCYHPKYTGTVWTLQLLAVLGMNGADHRVRNSCERFLKQHLMPDGGYACGVHSTRYSEECLTGRMAAVLLEFGYLPSDPRIKNALEWLLDHQLEDGGWNCRHGPMVSHSSIYSTYMALWAFSRIPQRERSSRIGRAVRDGIEFMLAHRLYKSHTTGQIIRKEWTRFHFPPNARYDILHSLKLLTDLEVTSDKRLNDALEIVESKMRIDGKWRVDEVPEGTSGKEGDTAIRLEREGSRSKWITLTALTVLSRTKRENITKIQIAA